jgi:hypothetical protein
MLDHAADESIHVDRFPFHALRLMRAIMIGDPVTIIAVDTPQRDGRTHHIFGEIGHQALIPGRHIPLLHIRHITTHRDEMLALATMQTAILDITHLVGIATSEHLVHEPIIVAGIVTRINVFEPLPVLDKELFEDVPVLSRLCHH